MTALELLHRLVELESPTSDAERLSHIGRFIAAELESLGGRVEFRGQPSGVADGRRRAAARPRGPHGHRVADGHADADAVPGRGRLCPRPRRARHEGRDRHGHRGRPPGGLAGRAGVRPHHGRRGDREPDRAARSSRSWRARRGPCSCSSRRSATARSRRRARASPATSFASAAAPPTPGNGWRAGVSAIEELAHQVAAVHALADEAAGIRTNVGQVGGGTGDNVVAAEAWARIDARAWTAQAQARLEAAIYGLEPRLDGATIEVSGAVTRPPMVQSDGRRRARRPGHRDRRRPRDRALRERVTRRLRRQLRGGRRHAGHRRARPHRLRRARGRRAGVARVARGAHVARDGARRTALVPGIRPGAANPPPSS